MSPWVGGRRTLAAPPGLGGPFEPPDAGAIPPPARQPERRRRSREQVLRAERRGVEVGYRLVADPELERRSAGAGRGRRRLHNRREPVREQRSAVRVRAPGEDRELAVLPPAHPVRVAPL